MYKNITQHITLFFNDEVLSIWGNSLSNILLIKSTSCIIYVVLYCWKYILFILFCLFIFASLSLKLFFASMDKHAIYSEDAAGYPHNIFSATYLILDVHSVIDSPDIPLLTKHQPTDEIRWSLHGQASLAELWKANHRTLRKKIIRIGLHVV